MHYLGETAGLLTSLFFAINAVVITRAGAKIGPIVLNRTRVVFALIYLILLNLILFRQPLPIGVGSARWLWLALSGVIGLAIGDAFLFRAYLSIGPRLGTLLLSLSTIFGALEAWFFFGETLRLGQIVGIALTLAGIIWVVLENGLQSPAPGSQASHAKPAVSGILFGILAGLGQATGLVFSRQGMQGDISPISGNVIRMLAAVITLWLITIMQKQAGSTLLTLKANPSAIKLVALAALIGPVIGVSLSLLAVQNTAVGVAGVLTSLAPIFMLAFSHFIFKERLGWQPIAGTLLAMSGVVILFLF